MRAGNRSGSRRGIDLDQLRAVACPIERAEELCKLARKIGTLPPALAALRTEAIIEARRTMSGIQIARRLRISTSRVYQLAPVGVGRG